MKKYSQRKHIWQKEIPRKVEKSDHIYSYEMIFFQIPHYDSNETKFTIT